MHITIDRLSKTYPGRKGEADVVALTDVSLEIKPGDFVSLVGPSGCGKSTLLRLIDGLLTPTSGEVRYAGRPVTGPSPDMAFVFQGAALLPWRTILQNVALGGRLRRKPKDRNLARATEALKLVGLSGFEHMYPHELSGGMQQRANIARALTVDSQVLLMDEPFGSLDAMTRQVMQNELLKLTEDSDRSVVFVTHSLEEATLLSDRVVVMTRRPGRVKAVVEVPFPRPRHESLRRSTEFQKLCSEMWEMIKEEVSDAL